MTTHALQTLPPLVVGAQQPATVDPTLDLYTATHGQHWELNPRPSDLESSSLSTWPHAPMLWQVVYSVGIKCANVLWDIIVSLSKAIVLLTVTLCGVYRERLMWKRRRQRCYTEQCCLICHNTWWVGFCSINSYRASRDNWCTVGEDGGCRVGEVQVGTTSPMPDHKGFKLQ